MSYEAQGIYIKILCFMWKDSKDQCSIRNDDSEISNALGISKKKWLRIRAEILRNGDPILGQKKDKLISKKLQKISKKMKEYRKKQAEKGKKSGLTRGATVKQRLNNGSTTAEPKGQPKGNSSSSSSSSLSNNKKNKNYSQQEIDKMFNEIEEIWPRTEDMGKAKEKYIHLIIVKKIDPQRIMNGAIGYLRCEKSKGTEKWYIKHLKTFLYAGNVKRKIPPTFEQYEKYADPKYEIKARL